MDFWQSKYKAVFDRRNGCKHLRLKEIIKYRESRGGKIFPDFLVQVQRVMSNNVKLFSN